MLGCEYMSDNWENNSIQFPRLIAELWGVLNHEQFSHLCDSMDLPMENVEELFTRANAEWEAIKDLNATVALLNDIGAKPGSTLTYNEYVQARELCIRRVPEHKVWLPPSRHEHSPRPAHASVP